METVGSQKRPRPRGGRALLLLALPLLAAACADDGGREPSPEGFDPAAPAPVTAAEAARDGDAPPPPVRVPDDAPLVVFLGDSVAAGLHVAVDEAFPAVVQRRLAAGGRPFRLVNAGISGGTTASGVSRLEWLLSQEPDVVVVELGANDGFRGVELGAIEANLREIVTRSQAAGARVLLLGMRLPPNYGVDYVAGFDAIYPRLAEETGAALVPFFMEGVAGSPELNLGDGIHPTAAGHRRLAATVAPALAPLLPNQD